ncbi:uncharacterized protein MYCGRDRAFT_103758 [Zymoseptoria tritici IPO323]|uniref:Uncharacterized protein n=1 Tax=Zymoseptoria tritici (strain CBS 115943 / IPO323) TaxID=336722 RepID=F9X5R7_ZYMTI|nr:uncharacterized protein MYCGRDRAFT_103758 [Zymoseptoria tritici IPO323]EGP88845.1 hypothetical protein MYCGRDRAFT_103758 [Zymoseptoria tritici IPO323]
MSAVVVELLSTVTSVVVLLMTVSLVDADVVLVTSAVVVEEVVDIWARAPAARKRKATDFMLAVEMSVGSECDAVEDAVAEVNDEKNSSVGISLVLSLGRSSRVLPHFLWVHSSLIVQDDIQHVPTPARDFIIGFLSRIEVRPRA